jgi:hypothetical protein
VPCWRVRRNEADDMVRIGCRLRARGRRCIGIDLTLYSKLVDWLYQTLERWGRIDLYDLLMKIEYRMSHASPSQLEKRDMSVERAVEAAAGVIEQWKEREPRCLLCRSTSRVLCGMAAKEEGDRLVVHPQRTSPYGLDVVDICKFGAL